MTEPVDPILDVHAFISIKVCSNGGVQISGNIADKVFALQLLDHAKDAIRSQRTSSVLAPDGSPIAIPSRDVALKQEPRFATTRTFGDMPPEDRGDPRDLPP